MSEPSEKEIQILDVVNDIVKGYAATFAKHGIAIQPLAITRYGDGDSYYSEIELDFWRSNNLVDVLSVLIFPEGKFIADHQLEGWLKKEISEL